MKAGVEQTTSPSHHEWDVRHSSRAAAQSGDFMLQTRQKRKKKHVFLSCLKSPCKKPERRNRWWSELEMHVPRDAVMMVTASKGLLLFVGFLLSSKLLLPVVKSVAFAAASLFPEQRLQAAEKQSEARPPARLLSSHCPLIAMHNSSQPPDGKISSPFVLGLLWHHSASGFVWREGHKEGGREGGGGAWNFSPPTTTSPPRSHWPLSIVSSGSPRALSSNQNGFQWGQRWHVAFYGP